jgi:hypothetical protein
MIESLYKQVTKKYQVQIHKVYGTRFVDIGPEAVALLDYLGPVEDSSDIGEDSELRFVVTDTNNPNYIYYFSLNGSTYLDFVDKTALSRFFNDLLLNNNHDYYA